MKSRLSRHVTILAILGMAAIPSSLAGAIRFQSGHGSATVTERRKA